LRLAVLASGFGSNLQAILDAIQRKEISGEVQVVISDVKDAYALERAKKHDIEAVHLDPRNYKSRGDFDDAIAEIMQQKQIELIILAGYMRLLSTPFVERFSGRIINIHPSLLPAFPGLHGVRQALVHGVKVSGCTVHFVDEGLDTGPIILQEAVSVFDDDTEDSLQERIHEVEHRLYPKAIQLFIENKLRLEERRCIHIDN